MADAAPPARIEGLDACRAVMMLGGIVLHASAWQDARPLFQAIADLSHSFRMGSFFALSGLLAGHGLAHRPIRAWACRRIAHIGPPTLFGLLVVCPLIRLELGLLPRGHVAGAPPLPFEWYHLWFLVALLLYVPLAAGVATLDRRWAITATMLRGYGGGDRSLAPLLLAIGGASLVLIVASTMALSVSFPFTRLNTWIEGRFLLGYAPMYLAGFALARVCGLHQAVVADWRSPVAILAVGALVHLGWFGLMRPPGDAQGATDVIVRMVETAFCPPAAFALIYRLATGIGRITPAMRLLAQGSFSIYITHFPIAILANMALLRMEWNVYVEFAITIALSGGLSLAFYCWAVRRSALLTWLFSGRPPGRWADWAPYMPKDRPRDAPVAALVAVPVRRRGR